MFLVYDTYIYSCEGTNDRKRMYGVNITNYYGHILESPIGVMMKEVRIDELFEYAGTGKVSSIDACNKGKYPCISGTITNNGIAKYIDTYDYDGIYLTCPSVSDVFKCYVQNGKFSARSSVNILKLKSEYQYLESSIGILAFIITLHISTGGYSYHGKNLLKDRLMNETIELPVVVRGLSESEIKQLIDGMVSTDELTNGGTNDKYTYEINENLLNNYIYTCLM